MDVTDDLPRLLLLSACLLVGFRAPAQSLEEVGVIRLPGGRITALAYSPDGRWLASGGEQGEVFLWKEENGERHLVLEVGDRPITELSFDSASSKLVVLARHLSLWDVETGETLKRFPALEGAMARSPDGRWIACQSNLKVVVLLDADDLERVREFHTRDGLLKRGIAFSPDGRYLAVGSVRGRIYEFEVENGNLLESRTPGEGVQDLAWPDGGPLVMAGVTGHVEFGDRAMRVGTRHNPAQIWVSMDGSRIAVGSGDETVVMDVEGNELEKLGSASALAMHPDGETLAIARDAVIEVRSGDKVRFRLDGHYVRPNYMAVSGDGKFLAVASQRGRLLFHELGGSEADRIRDLRPLVVHGLFGYAGGTEILIDTEDDLALWSPELGLRVRRLPQLPRPSGPKRESLSPDGRWLARGNGIHDLYGDRQEVGFEQEHLSRHIWTGDSRHLITAYRPLPVHLLRGPRPMQGELRVFDLQGREVAHRPYGPGEAGVDLSLTPDGKVAVALRSRVRFLDPRTLEELGSIPARAHLWRSLDKDYGVSFGEDGLELWDLRQAVPIQRLGRFKFGGWRYTWPPEEQLSIAKMEVSRDGMLALKSEDRILLYRLKK